MKLCPFLCLSPRLVAAGCLLLTGLLSNFGALAAELPKRKPGLWEINTQTQGVPNLGPLQQCIGPNTDELMLQNARKKDCRVLELKPAGSRVTLHSVCTIDGSTATTDGALEGDFNARYSGTFSTRFAPAWKGMSTTTTTHAGRWLGPCKAGQKPGETILPTVGGVDLNKVMKDPQVQDLMKRLQGR